MVRKASRYCCAGANDQVGTLMNESITRAAGAVHGEELPPAEMEALDFRHRSQSPRSAPCSTRMPAACRRDASFAAAPLAAPILTPAHRYEREQPNGNMPPPHQHGEQLTKIGFE